MSGPASDTSRSALVLVGLVGLAACFRSGFEAYPDGGRGARDGSAAFTDAAGADLARVEAGTLDAVADAGRGDQAAGDASRADAAVRDAPSADAVIGDGGGDDADTEDADVEDAGAEDAGTEDAGAPDPFVVSHTVLATGRYVELDVDWDRQLAYLSSQEPGVCFEVVDFSDELAPTVIASLGPATVPATICDASRGNQLFDGGTKLIVTSHDPGNLEIWDLGVDPRAGQYQQLASYTIGHMRRVAGVDEAGAIVDIYMCKRDGVRTFEFDPAGPTVLETGQWIGTDNQADAATVDFTFAFTASWIADAPIKIIRLADMQEVQSFDMSNGVNSNGLWSVAVSSDGTRAFFGGWVSAFFACDSSALDAPCILTQRFDNDDRFRDVVFVDAGPGGSLLLYAIRSDLVLDVFEATDVSAPIHVSQHAIGVGGAEAYGIRVDPSTHRAIIVTTAGDFVVGDTRELRPATAPYPEF